MRVRICRLTDLQAGDEFYISSNIEDRDGNIYLAKSRFTVLGIDNGRSNSISKLYLRDEEGRDIDCSFGGSNLRLTALGNIYKH